ncbi:MAG: NrfD/PsrC family molybdoenzyme membrane anchor subunit [Candidatus Hydrothermarchaeales archaeon]
MDENPDAKIAIEKEPRYEWVTQENLVWWSILSLGVFALLTFLFMSFLKNHEALYHGSKFVPWVLLLNVYFFFAVSSTGVGFVSSFGHVFGFKKYTPIGRYATFLSIILLFAAFAGLAMEQERTFRTFIWMALSPNFSSPLVWMGIFYLLKIVWEISDFIFATLHRHNLARVSATFALLSGIAAVSNLGSVYGLNASRPIWQGTIMPIYFILAAITSGLAFTILMLTSTYYAWKREIPPHLKETLYGLGKILTFSLAVLLFFTIWNLRTGLWTQPERSEEIMILLRGELAINFWVFEMLIGILIPLALLILRRPRTINAVFFSSFFVVVGMFMARYDLLTVGQLIPVFGSGYHAVYLPSLIEWAATFAIFGLAAYFYTLGVILFGFRELEIAPGEE